MPDVYANISAADEMVLMDLARILELRAADPQQAVMRAAYQADIDLRHGSQVLEVGCGTGPVSRSLARLCTDCQVCGLDPCAFFLARARQLSRDFDNLRFQEGDACQLPFSTGAFDVVVFHTTLCHVPDLNAALAEAHRVLRPGGQVVIFDADYSSTTVASDASDPLQACAAATVASIVHDPHLVQKLRSRLQQAGFRLRSFRSHGYHGVTDATYMLTIVDRGADALVRNGRIGTELAAALKHEARRRVEEGSFFGHLAYASAIATRQPPPTEGDRG